MRVTRDARISHLVLLPSGCLDDEGVPASLLNESTVELKFRCSAVLLDHSKITSSIVLFCRDLDVRSATLLAQGLMEFFEQFQAKEGNTIVSTCRIDLPFEVKPDFNENVITVANNSTIL